MANPTVTPIMTPARGPNVPDAQSIYIVDVYGNPITSINPAPITLYDANGNRIAFNADNSQILNVTSGTTTQTSPDQTNISARGAYIIVNVTTLTGTTPTLTPLIQGKAPVANQYFTLLLATTAISANGKFVYLVYPNAPAGAGGVTQSIAFSLPKTWNVVMTVGGTVTAEAYTVEVSYLI